MASVQKPSGPSSATRATQAGSVEGAGTRTDQAQTDAVRSVDQAAGPTEAPGDGYEQGEVKPQLIEVDRSAVTGKAAPAGQSLIGLLGEKQRSDATLQDKQSAEHAEPAPREGHRIILADPTNSPADTLASHSAAVTGAMAYGLERLAEKYPDVEQSFAARFLEMSLVTGALVPKTVLEHEMGHARAVNKAGGDPEIKMTGWMSGYTSYDGLPDDPEGKNRIIASAAGVNQGQINAEHMYKTWARNGSAHYQEAMGYLLNQTNLGLYAARSVARGDGAPSSDDIDSYVRLMNRNGHKISKGQILTIAAATDLASAPVWAALKGQYDFLATGDRHVEIPTFKIGELSATFPNFQTHLTSDGPVVGGQLLVSPEREHPVELSFHTRIDGSAMAVGAKVFDLPITEQMTVNPYLRVTQDRDQGLGCMVGTEVNYRVGDSIDLTGQVEVNHNDLLTEPYGKDNGISAFVGVRVRF